MTGGKLPVTFKVSIEMGGFLKGEHAFHSSCEIPQVVFCLLREAFLPASDSLSMLSMQMDHPGLCNGEGALCLSII